MLPRTCQESLEDSQREGCSSKGLFVLMQDGQEFLKLLLMKLEHVFATSGQEVSPGTHRGVAARGSYNNVLDPSNDCAISASFSLISSTDCLYSSLPGGSLPRLIALLLAAFFMLVPSLIASFPLHLPLPTPPNQAVRHVIPDLFRGGFSYVTTCQACGRDSAGSSRISDFYELSLQVLGHSSLLESIVAMLSPEELVGENQYYCEYCAAKQNAQRQMRLRSLPPYLSLNLQRFVFDMKVGQGLGKQPRTGWWGSELGSVAGG
jgi:hypothetical protein